MDNLDFFLGERSHTFLRTLYRGKARFKWTVTERWDERLGRSLNCGMERTYTLKKLLGVSSVEREELESSVIGSLGKKGIFELKSEVKSKLAKELRLEETLEEEEEFHFQAPKCGRLTLRVYQFKRLHEFSYVDNRFWLWRKDNFTKTITEWVNYLYDNSVIVDVDPACKCEDPSGNGIEGLVKLSFDRIDMLVGYKHTDRGLEVPSLNIILPDKRIEEILFDSFSFDRRRIPGYLLFLAGERSTRLTGRFLPSSSTILPETLEHLLGQNPPPDREVEQREGSRRRKADDSMNLIYLLLGGGIGAVVALLVATGSVQEFRGDISDAIRKAIDRLRKQLGLYADDYYEPRRVPYAPYDTATAKAAEAGSVGRDTEARQAGSLQAAVEVGKRAYLLEKRKTELSGGSEAAPSYDQVDGSKLEL